MEMIRKYQVLLNTRPVLTRALTGFGISFLSDFLSQYIECKIEGFDFMQRYGLMRSMNLAVYNCVVISPTFYYWYRFLAFRYPGSAWRPFLKKLLLDRLLIPPPLILGFFVSQTLMNGGSLKDVEARVEGHYINTLKMNLVVWPAAMLVNFKYIPLQYQVLYANLVGFIWTIYLSWAIHKHKIVYDEII